MKPRHWDQLEVTARKQNKSKVKVGSKRKMDILMENF